MEGFTFKLKYMFDEQTFVKKIMHMYIFLLGGGGSLKNTPLVFI